MNKKLNKKGFTLIEVVLVLAIGGLIFLLAFLAFQQVSRNRRDTQRRTDLGRIVAELQNYAGDKNGQIPAVSVANTSSADGSGICGPAANVLDVFNSFTSAYLCTAGKFYSPAGRNYTVVNGSDSAAPGLDQIKYSSTRGGLGAVVSNTYCDGSAMAAGGFKVEMGLESGVACRDSK